MKSWALNVNPSEFDELCELDVVDSDEMVVARVFGYDTYPESYILENAALISAAPDLLKACKLAESLLSKFNVDTRELKAAIRKATDQ